MAWLGGRDTGRTTKSTSRYPTGATRQEGKLAEKTVRYIYVDSLSYVVDYADIQLRDMPEACSLFRSARSTHGFDIIVMDGQKDDALKQLASNKKAFGTDGWGTWEETI